MSRLATYALVVYACLVALPSVARAQSVITGVVKDTSGAVLPGVTVEAASDALIEKSKTVVTDGQGLYRIVDLRPGTYAVTFTLPGFQTLVRDQLALPSEFTMTINADMTVGALEESVTVSGAAPVVDVSSAVHTQVLNREAIDAIPTGRTIQGLGQLVVGVSLNLPDTGGARAMQQTYMSTHGMPAASNTVMIDGMIVNGLQSDGAIQSYFNDSMNQEVSYQTSGISAETSSGGVRLNMIPREGGNQFSGDTKFAYRPGSWQGDNVTPRLQAVGVKPGAGNSTDRIVDLSVAEGGPIMKDRLWFFASARYFSVNNFIANTTFANGSQGIDNQYIRSALARVTWQITPKLKFSAYQDQIDKYRGHDMQSYYEPETAAIQWFSPAYHTNQAKLSATITPRLLVEGGFSSNLEYYTNSYQNGIGQPRFTDAWYNTTAQYDSIQGGVRRAGMVTNTGAPNTQSPARFNWQGATSYVTGSHNLKAGVQYQHGTYYHDVDMNGDLLQVYQGPTPDARFTNPVQVIVRNSPLLHYGERLNYDIGLYAQDTWTMKRLTLNGGFRWEWLNAQVMPSHQGAGRFVPERDFKEVLNVPNWSNPAPRFSAVYDLFGNSKTALKYSVNRYNQTRTTGIAALYNPAVSTSATLTWRDGADFDPNHTLPTTGDGIAQGGVTFDANGVPHLCTLGPGCEISGTLPANFGIAAQNTYGGFPRTWNLEHGIELQHELFPRLSLSGTWFHGNFHNLTTSINSNLSAADYTPIAVYNPVTGAKVDGVYSRIPGSSNTVNNVDAVDPSKKLIYDSYGLEFRARLGRGAQIFGGTAFERQLSVDCNHPDNPNLLMFCDDTKNNIPFAKQFKIAGSYPLPWYGIQLSGSFQSNPGPSGSSFTTTQYIAANTSARYPANCPAPCPAGQLVLPTGFIGAPATSTSINIPLVAPNAYYIERINQLDLKVQKTFKVNHVTISPQFEMFNVNNSDAIISTISSNILASTYRFANSVMQPRMMGVGAQVKW
ncbi:MAG: carboxypeptidase regulatory-like domain-containing protein [Acidobacteriaceae bacterium]|jgi:hypothetical protein|nr:carboxypeptidase regulatory-like domain-containing protein [Acidobacteriaceae bacterium]